MSKRPAEQNPHAHKSESQIDHTVEDSFPASDPPATGGTTRIEPDETQHKHAEKRDHAKQTQSH
jgi:hypothetical protein